MSRATRIRVGSVFAGVSLACGARSLVHRYWRVFREGSQEEVDEVHREIYEKTHRH